MKASINKTKARHALTELKAASSHLGDIRPGDGLEPGEFFELCDIQQAVKALADRLDKMMKGGES